MRGAGIARGAGAAIGRGAGAAKCGAAIGCGAATACGIAGAPPRCGPAQAWVNMAPVKKMEVAKHSAVNARSRCRNMSNTPAKQIQFESSNAAPHALFPKLRRRSLNEG